MQHEENLIHLLYVPTIYCNLGCSYCYLGKQTDTDMLKKDFDRALSTLKTGVEKFKAAGYTPFNISLHGGEVTTLPSEVLQTLFDYIQKYYESEKATLDNAGFKKTNPHIKTNLYNFDKHYDVMNDYQVSISASVDLPLSLHEKYRTTKTGGSTLKRTLDNIKLLSQYPNRKKMSAVVYAEHLDKVDEIIADIWHLHNNIGIDMNYFNFMFGFESEDNDEKFIATDTLNTKAVSGDAQVAFYNRLKQEFIGTDLEMGFHKHWFDEFTPKYCTNAFNCGEKFFLLQSDGNIYSCVRGQGTPEFKYGNIFEDDIERIMENAASKISNVHRAHGLHEDCKSCEYLSICHTGCAYVKHEQNNAKSYTCSLQKEIYKSYPHLYPPTPKDNLATELAAYTVDMHPQLIASDLKPNIPGVILPNDLYQPGNELQAIIDHDTALQMLYSNNALQLSVNTKRYNLESQILKPARDILTLSPNDTLTLSIKKEFFNAACDDPIRNTLHLQMLRDTQVTYGDEQRTKQEHTFTLEIFKSHLIENKTHFEYTLSNAISLFEEAFLPNTLNNLLITSGYLRKYHYEKQKKNAFYHIQAINLPFQNFEFYWNSK